MFVGQATIWKGHSCINKNYFYCTIIYNQQHTVSFFYNILITVNFKNNLYI